MTDPTERRLRVGVLGAGQIAQAAHLEATRKARNAELYALCDSAEDLLAPVAAAHRPQVTYGDYDEMLADPLVDAVIVAVADQFHVAMALKAIEAGKHVLVEKPMGVDRRGVRGARRRGRGVRAGAPGRHHAPLRPQHRARPRLHRRARWATCSRCAPGTATRPTATR